MQKKLIQFTDELWAAIDAARGDIPRNPWLESQLWRLKRIKDGANLAEVDNPARPLDGRGKWPRS